MLTPVWRMVRAVLIVSYVGPVVPPIVTVGWPWHHRAIRLLRSVLLEEAFFPRAYTSVVHTGVTYLLPLGPSQRAINVALADDDHSETQAGLLTPPRITCPSHLDLHVTPHRLIRPGMHAACRIVQTIVTKVRTMTV